MLKLVFSLGRLARVCPLFFGIAACGGVVDVAGSGGAGTGSSTSTHGTSSSSSGDAPTGMLPAPTCAADEGAIVAGVGSHTLVAVDRAGAWKLGPSLPQASALTTYVDANRDLGVLWVDASLEPSGSHYRTTHDGVTFAAHDMSGWTPLAGDPLSPVAVAPNASFATYLIGDTGAGTTIGEFYAGAPDWYPSVLPATPFRASSAAYAPGVGTLAVGVDSQWALCDVRSAEDIDVAGWHDVHCRPEALVDSGGEIPRRAPQASSLPNGDIAVVFFARGGMTAQLAATVLHEGTWTTPVPIGGDEIGIEFASAASPDGDVLVGVVSTSGVLTALRFVPGTGWAKPMTLDVGLSPEARIGVAPGICGDDALFAYPAGMPSTDVRVARIRGNDYELATVATLGDASASRVSIATRNHASAP